MSVCLSVRPSVRLSDQFHTKRIARGLTQLLNAYDHYNFLSRDEKVGS